MQDGTTIENRAALKSSAWLYGALSALLPAALVIAVCFPALGVRSLWLDEAWVANAILRGVFEPHALRHTPIGWALLVSAVVRMFGATEAWFRAVPLAFGAGAVVLTYVAAANAAGNRLAGCIAALFLATNLAALSYCRQVKLYTADMFFVCLITIAAQNVATTPSLRNWLAFLVAAGLAPFFSFGSAFVVPASACAQLIVLFSRRSRTEMRSWFLAYTILGFIYAGYWFSFLRGQTSSALTSYWSAGFPPSLHLLALASWLAMEGLALAKYFFTPLGFFQALCVVAGAFLLAMRRPVHAVLLIGPTLFAVIGALVHVYPFDAIQGRVLLFLLPGMMILAGLTVSSVLHAATRGGFHRLAIASLLTVAVALPCIRTVVWGASGPLPFVQGIGVEELRDLVTKVLLPRVGPGDLIYVYYGASEGFQFYAPQFRSPQLEFGEYQRIQISGVTVIFGGIHRSAPSQYAPELRSLLQEGHWQRVWLLFSHTLGDEQRRLIETLGQNNSLMLVSRPGADLYEIRFKAAY